MLNSAEHSILNTHKYKNIKKIAFSDSDKPRTLFFLLINVKIPTIVGILLFFLLINVNMPTIVGILTFMCRKKFGTAE